jgi:hypothetical protein
MKRTIKPQNLTSGRYCVRKIASGVGAIGDGVTSALNALFSRYATKGEAQVVAAMLGTDYDAALFRADDFFSEQQRRQGQTRPQDMRAFSVARYLDLA